MCGAYSIRCDTVLYLIWEMQVIVLQAEAQDKLIAIVQKVVERSTVSQRGGNLQSKEVPRRRENKLLARISRAGGHRSAWRGVGMDATQHNGNQWWLTCTLLRHCPLGYLWQGLVHAHTHTPDAPILLTVKTHQPFPSTLRLTVKHPSHTTHLVASLFGWPRQIFSLRFWIWWRDWHAPPPCQSRTGTLPLQ